MRNIMFLLIVSIAVVSLSACATGDRSEATKAPPTAAEIATMTLPQRAALIEELDPINRVEVLLGIPVYMLEAESFDLEKYPDLKVVQQRRYYRLSQDVVLEVIYSPSTNMRLIKDTMAARKDYGDLPEHKAEIARMKNSGKEVVANGYADWIVCIPVKTHQRGIQIKGDWGSYGAALAFLEMDTPSSLNPKGTK